MDTEFHLGFILTKKNNILSYTDVGTSLILKVSVPPNEVMLRHYVHSTALQRTKFKCHARRLRELAPGNALVCLFDGSIRVNYQYCAKATRARVCLTQKRIA